MKDFDKNKKSLFLKYCDINNLYGAAMSQTLPLNDFKWVDEASEFNEYFVKSYNDERYGVTFLEVDVQHPENLRNLHNCLTFLTGRIKFEKSEILVANLHDKEEYVIHIRNLKQRRNHELVLKNCMESWLKPCIDMNTELIKTAKNDFENGFLS